ncbi:bacteriocin [Nostoc sp.]|uniref:bacteriocin n=1 Tax=Nostoc sp. TaxID=1180 RepID=UPI002FFA3F36
MTYQMTIEKIESNELRELSENELRELSEEELASVVGGRALTNFLKYEIDLLKHLDVEFQIPG